MKTTEFTCPPEHRHAAVGTCYVTHRCRCAPCGTAQSARSQARRRLQAYGRYDSGLVDAQPVREHIEVLRSHGMGYKTIALRAGIGPTGVRTLIYGREHYIEGGVGPRHGEALKRVSRVKAERILAVQPTLDMLPSTASVPARGSVRRVQALIASGWSQARIEQRLGWGEGNLSKLRNQYERSTHRNRVMVFAATALRMEQIYDELSVTPPPNVLWRDKIAVSRSRRLGREQRWPLPMDWEASDNDFDCHRPVSRSAA